MMMACDKAETVEYNVFDVCDYIVLNKNLQQLRALFTKVPNALF